MDVHFTAREKKRKRKKILVSMFLVQVESKVESKRAQLVGQLG